MTRFDAAQDMRDKAKSREDRIIDGIDRSRDNGPAIASKKKLIARGVLHPDCSYKDDWRFREALEKATAEARFPCLDCHYRSCPAHGTDRPWSEAESRVVQRQVAVAAAAAMPKVTVEPTVEARETTKQVAERMGISPRKVRQLRREGKLPPA